ncbi:uncharacterized protein LOC123528503 [Mercenaria mercenaria]|uniref:uncharacterized protein LOC123528503 n=1 Tax=Mercenaria mercenaria TaxID=6596 RepID=UPI00234E8D43|nr:uncharacterized protein LOC123528503 [Mercenaria mercenaria]
MRVVFLTAFIFISFGVSLLYAARWSEWQDLTICTAKPCKCRDENEKCASGKKVQIRTCIREDGDTSICQWQDGAGAMKLDESCKNENVCPGWSDWIPIGNCDCKNEIQMVRRLCNSPVPIHPDVLCINKNTGEMIKEQKRQDPCNCTEEEKRARAKTTTTTTTSTTTTPLPTTPLPCCEDNSYYDYNVTSYDDDELLNQATTTTSKPLPTRKLSALEVELYAEYDSMYGSLPEEGCRPCGNATESGENDDIGDYNGGSDVFG